MKQFVLFLLLAGLLVLEPGLSRLRVQTHLENAAAPSKTEFVLQFLGELRYTLAAYLWLKTEIYHHELGLNSVSSQVGREDPKQVGEILGICRLVIRLDPEFVQAYDVGSWRLARGLARFPEAIAFLEEGLKANPDNAILNDDIGQIYFFDLKDCPHAFLYFEKAARANPDSAAMGRELRIMGRCAELTGSPEKARQAYERLLMLNPNDPFPLFRLRALREHSYENRTKWQKNGIG